MFSIECTNPKATSKFTKKVEKPRRCHAHAPAMGKGMHAFHS